MIIQESKGNVKPRKMKRRICYGYCVTDRRILCDYVRHELAGGNSVQKLIKHNKKGMGLPCQFAADPFFKTSLDLYTWG